MSRCPSSLTSATTTYQMASPSSPQRPTAKCRPTLPLHHSRYAHLSRRLLCLLPYPQPPAPVMGLVVWGHSFKYLVLIVCPNFPTKVCAHNSLERLAKMSHVLFFALGLRWHAMQNIQAAGKPGPQCPQRKVCHCH